jgi:hypothetical protein
MSIELLLPQEISLGLQVAIVDRAVREPLTVDHLCP